MKIPSTKFQINPNDQNSRFETVVVEINSDQLKLVAGQAADYHKVAQFVFIVGRSGFFREWIQLL